ncbi:MAG: hypothetical protein HS115_12315 [Spirochaetales bacterium]|nr:hypothetical protein [Spirochaetales bacterium]
MIRSIKMRIVFLSALCLIVTALLAQELEDTHTPQNFLFDRQSRVVAEYIDTVLKRGDAADLVPAVAHIHGNLKQGSYSAAELEVMEVNLLTLISTAEGLIRSQEYPDKMPLTDEVMEAQNQAGLEEWRSEMASLTEEDAPEVTESYTPPEHDKIYNEKKKDLLEESYEMLETIRARR